ncbi:MAG TPA: RimK family alpha-L-glutamate ligase [Gallionellaceae bacterium]|nr:RimK family alpha-L-glutamate ligase [Gallionellaceae bacterium]
MRSASPPGAEPYRLAILFDPDNPEPPSNPSAMQKFLQAAAAVGLRAELISPDDLERVPQFDALFIRDTTYTNHYSYLFSTRAAEEGMVVIDDPNSILKCNNKALQAQLFARHKIPAPRTLVVHRRNLKKIIPTIGLPCVLKLPDSSFSRGVVKVDTEAEMQQELKRLFGLSKMLVAQQYLPTPFDWRIGILDRQVLFVCQYHMVPGYWQIIRHADDGSYEEGATITLAPEEAPQEALRLALRSANLIGDGLYGVDIKQAGAQLYVIEINDNPNIDAGNEDAVLGDELYRRIMGSFATRIQQRRAQRAAA